MKYRSDKTLGGHPVRKSHNYDIVYEKLFEPIRDDPIKVFELGIGSVGKGPSAMGEGVKPGASLRAWKEYFPKAEIFGADIDPECLFQEPRIRTSVVDQRDPASIAKMWESIGKVDIIIDDGLHDGTSNITFYEHSIKWLRKGGLYIIEDIKLKHAPMIHEYFSRQDRTWVMIELGGTKKRDNRLLISNG